MPVFDVGQAWMAVAVSTDAGYNTAFPHTTHERDHNQNNRTQKGKEIIFKLNGSDQQRAMLLEYHRLDTTGSSSKFLITHSLRIRFEARYPSIQNILCVQFVQTQQLDDRLNRSECGGGHSPHDGVLGGGY